MKKGITLLALAASTMTVAADMPTVYGKINKAWTITDQDTNENIAKRGSSRGLTDVANSGSRLGVKGEIKNDAGTVSYKVEMGIGTDANTDFKMRQAVINLDGKYGKLSVGQTYAPLAKLARSVDPLQGTTAGFQGKDINNSIENGTTAIGFEDRSRTELVGYTSPMFYGLTYKVATDRANDNDNSSTATPTTSFEHLVEYSRDMGMLKLGLFVGQRKSSTTGTGDDTNMVYGAKIGHGAFGLNVAMSAAEVKDAGETDEENRVFAALSYKMSEKHSFALTHQTKESINGSAQTTQDYSQMAFGYTHKCNKNVAMNLTYAMFETEASGDGYATDAAKEAAQVEASQIGLGLTVKF